MYLYTLSISVNMNSLTEMVIAVCVRGSCPLILSRNLTLTKANNMVHIWPRYGNGMGCSMVDVWFSY